MEERYGYCLERAIVDFHLLIYTGRPWNLVERKEQCFTRGGELITKAIRQTKKMTTFWEMYFQVRKINIYFTEDVASRDY